MRRNDVVIVGAGQAGLAASSCLSNLGIDHVVLERGTAGESWRRERWDSLTLLSPNWHSRLPGFAYDGDEPDGYMTAKQTADFIQRYATRINAPVEAGTTVEAVRQSTDGFSITTDRGVFLARAVVLANGACGRPSVPPLAKTLSADVHQISPLHYKNPEQLPPGGVLVVGASASGTQIALELLEAGRNVHVAVGGHFRAPRTWRGKDIIHWLDRAGLFDQTLEDIPDKAKARTTPSFQLIGRADRSDLDLNRLQQLGAVLHGKVVTADGDQLRFADNLEKDIQEADQRLIDLLAVIARNAGGTVAGPVDEFVPTKVPSLSPTKISLRQTSISTVIWATGFRPDLTWFDGQLVGRDGYPRHEAGRCNAHGLFTLGMPFLRKRKSNFIDGVGEDAAVVATAIAEHLGMTKKEALHVSTEQG